MSRAPQRELPCPVCGGTDFRRVFPVSDASGAPNALLRCKGCRLALAARLPDPETLRRHYSAYSYAGAAAWEVPHATRRSLARTMKRLAAFRCTGRMLDVGCGAGAVLSAAAAAGWVTEGTELSWVAARRLRQSGYTVHVGPLEDLHLEEGVFDVVVLSEVLEHLPGPRETLVAARRLLRPGGAVYLTTPNFDALARRALGSRWRVVSLPDHLCYFNRDSLRTALLSCGLRPMRVVTEGFSPFELLAANRRAEGPARAGCATERLRELSSWPGPLARMKGVANGLLRLTNLGDTVKSIAVRPAESTLRGTIR